MLFLGVCILEGWRSITLRFKVGAPPRDAGIRAAEAPSPAAAGPRHPRNRGTETGLRSLGPQHATKSAASWHGFFSKRPPECCRGSSLPQGRLGRETLHSQQAILAQQDGCRGSLKNDKEPATTDTRLCLPWFAGFLARMPV